ncbi:MAG: TonB-dependent receptor, partial [Pseudomonadota bacterium]
MTTENDHRRRWLRAALRTTALTCIAAVVGALPTPTLAQTAQVYDFAIPPSPLSVALDRLAAEAGLTMTYDQPAIADLQGNAVSGSLTGEQALDQLLSGTGLTASFVGASSVVIEAASAIDSPGALILDQLLVVGERVERSVFETPSSVVVVTGETIEETPSIANVEDVLRTVPNITLNSGTNNGPSIRGFATQGPTGGAQGALSGLLPRTAVTVDGRALTSNEGLFGSTSVWDLESVEVFRGPQTTSQGVNSIAGAIVLNTRDPSFEFEAAAQGQFAIFNDRQGSGMLNIPLIDDELAVRATLDYRHRDVFVNYGTPEQRVVEESTKDVTFEGRVKLLWEP